MRELTSVLMGEEEARACVDHIKANLETTRTLLGELYEREGWRALGYPSWARCITEEFHMSEQRAHQLLNAHMVDRILAPPIPESTIVDRREAVAEMKEGHARELEPLVADPEAVREVYAEVQEATDGKPTAAAYREAVERRLGPSASPVVGDVQAEIREHFDEERLAAEEALRRHIDVMARVRLTWLRFADENPPDVFLDGLDPAGTDVLIRDLDRLVGWLKEARSAAVLAKRPYRVV